MKSYPLVTLLILMALNNLFGEVRNGYERDFLAYSASLESLKRFLNTHHYLAPAQKRQIKERIRSLINFMVYYQITDSLLKQYRMIAPELYGEIDALTDCNGRPIDVYVKFIPKDELKFQAAGTASFTQSGRDPDQCKSQYGEASVSIEVWVFHRALFVLSHEFGHLKYAVPNLRSYVKFYKKRYRDGADIMPGHRADDPSGRTAIWFEERFRSSYAQFLKQDLTAAVSPMVLINPIRRSVMGGLE